MKDSNASELVYNFVIVHFTLSLNVIEHEYKQIQYY